MKKRTLIAATALTLTCLGGQSIVAQAATTGNCITLPNGGKVIVGYGSGCDIEDFKDIWDKLGNCSPEISFPDFNPGNNDSNGSTPEDIPSVEDAPSIEDAPSVEDAPSIEESPSDEHAFLKQIVELVNAERAKEGLSPLSIDTKVQAVANVRAKECEQLFSHTRPDGSSFTTALKEQNVSYRSAGENIAWGQRSPKEVMEAWMNSSGHRANIMNPDFTTIGVGYYENAAGTDYWCQIFTR